jgi:diaminohydroxyphosphoribosylaminopyrimidine deaminase/5-amino-6-(5-phosphoribosylamino)uracil reductase
MRIVADSQLRIPLDSAMVTGCSEDLAILTTSAASPERRRALEKHGVKVLTCDGSGGRTDLLRLVQWLGEEERLSLMIEAGSMLNWAVLESGIVDKVFFYYAPKILGGTESLPMAGGAGRRRRMDAILLRDVKVHAIAADEIALEAYVRREF